MPWVPRNTVLLHSILYLCKQLLWFRVDFFHHNKGKRGKTYLLKNKQESHANALAWPTASVSLVKVSCLKCSLGQNQWCIYAWCSGSPFARSGGSLWEPRSGQAKSELPTGACSVEVSFHSLLTVLDVLDKFHFHWLKTYFQSPSSPPPRTYSIFLKSSRTIFASPKIRHFSLRESKVFLIQRTSAFQINGITVLPVALKYSTILERTPWLKPLPPWNFCKIFSN